MNRPLTLARRSFLAGQAATLALIGGCSAPLRAVASPPQDDLVQEILAFHNRYRAAVGVPALRWSDSLAAGAQQWADYLAPTGRLEHSEVGENLAAGWHYGTYSVTQLVDTWGYENFSKCLQHRQLGGRWTLHPGSLEEYDASGLRCGETQRQYCPGVSL